MKQNLNIFATLVVLALAGVTSVASQDEYLLPQNQPQLRHPSLNRARRMYALCPPDFMKIGSECYYISKSRESWLDAHFECKDRNSKLAEPLKYADRRLRKYLMNRDHSKDDNIWIGGMYNWQTNKWQWGYNGGDMKYFSFGDLENHRSNLQYRCTSYDPSLDYKWSSELCTKAHRFICQHRMRYVNSRNRQEIYAKWNETYPNQLANEVEVYLSANGNKSRSYYRAVPKKQLRQQPKPIQMYTQKPKVVDDLSDASSPPDYLPYNVYKNLQPMHQKPAEDAKIHPVMNDGGELAPPKDPKKKRHSKLKLTGEVDLGQGAFRARNERRKKKKKLIEASTRNNDVFSADATTPRERDDFDLNEVVTASEPRVVFVTSTQRPTLRLEFETSEEPIEERTARTTTASVTEQSPEIKKKLQEKAMRRQKLIEKLKQLTPEERQAFLLMKKQRADARKKGMTYGH